jgi:hypothetical protein
MAISFMEAPLKFTAPGISMEEGVTIGRIIFSALNKLEWCFFLVLVSTCFFNRPDRPVILSVLALGLVLSAETFMILPLLDQRALQIIRGHTPASGNMHLAYIILELLKIPLLAFIGWKSLTRKLFYNYVPAE